MFYKLNVQFSDEFLNSKITILCCCSTFNYLNLFFFLLGFGNFLYKNTFNVENKDYQII